MVLANNDDQSDDYDSDDFFSDFKRRKRSVVGDETVVEAGSGDTDLRYANFEEWERPKGGFDNCTCYWGLFRDRNVTLRKPVSFSVKIILDISISPQNLPRKLYRK